MDNEDAPQQQLKSAISDIFSGILATVGTSNERAYLERSEDPATVAAVAALRNGDFENWNRQQGRSWEAYLDGLLEHVFPGNSKAQFAVGQYEFLARHIRNTIREYEGWSAYYDKAGKVQRKLTAFLVTGRPIVYDPAVENEFSRPKKVFTTHDEIVAFFEAVYSMYHGSGGAYVDLVTAMRARSK